MVKSNTGRRLPSVLRWILWVLLVQFILINISASFYAYRLTHFYEDSSLLVYRPTTNVFAKTWKLFTGPKFGKSTFDAVPDFPFDAVKLTTKSKLVLDAWYIKTDSISRGTVILFHGITSNKLAMLAEAAQFRFLRFDVLLVDFRAHGNSAGKTTTIGYRETEDLKLAYDWVKDRGEKNIYLWGSSMGAVVVAKAINDYSLNPSGIILEMPFLSMESHLKARARVLGFPQQPFGFLVTLWISIERGFNGFRHDTDDYVKKVNCPVLLQWGALDPYVLQDETARIFSSIASKEKKIVVYESAGHESMFKNDPLRWRKEVSDFLGKVDSR
jgi:alpha-beta hydrolase superfamily lysophospholipase